VNHFIYQVVAALPEHAHLFGEPGCFMDYDKPNRECGKGVGGLDQQKAARVETPLDPAFHPLKLTEEQDKAWVELVRKNIPSALVE